MGIFSKNKTSSSPSLHRSKSGLPLDARLQLVTGKGGVGRTTVAIALAQAYAKAGQRVLILEVRDAESELAEQGARDERSDSMLGRALSENSHDHGSIALGPMPRLVTENLWAAQLVSAIGHERYLSAVIPVERLIRAALESKPLSRFLRSAPSMHELGVFYHLSQFNEDEQFDRVIVDLPASGHTLALTQLPERMARILKRGPIVEGLRRGVQTLADPSYTALWVVTLPERLPVTEALELASSLSDDGVEAAGVILNRAAPKVLSQEEQVLLKSSLVKSVQSKRLSQVAILNGAYERQMLSDELSAFQRCLIMPELADGEKRALYVGTEWLASTGLGVSND